MATPKKLKVYRTPIGFHDAYVAAPSQKAALEAWGSTHNLFARGVAEMVTDDALIEAPLAQPGVVIKRSRGTTAEQIAALPADKPARAARTEASDSVPKKQTPKPKPKPKPQPHPSHDAVDAAEGELAEIKDRHADAERALADEQAALDRRRADLDKQKRAEVESAQRALDRAEKDYAAAIRAWRG